MILCIDIGNTNIKYGIFENSKLIASFRIASKKTSTADEYGVIVCNLLASAGINNDDIEGIIMSSVIPQLNYTMAHMCEYYLGKTPLMVEPGLKTGINLKVESPKEVGADRIVNSVAAYKKYGGEKPVICIETGIFFSSAMDAERKTGIPNGNISNCCLGKQNVAGGYHWKFIRGDDVDE